MKKFDNYCANLQVLMLAEREDLNNDFIISGIIDKFMLQFELGWKVLKELLSYEGHRIAITGSPREIIKTAYATYDFIEEDVWLAMLRERNDLSHIYDGNAARNMTAKIIAKYIPAFIRLKENIENNYNNILSEL